MSDDSKTLHYSLSIESSLAKLVDVLGWFESCHSSRIPVASWLSIKIALAEAFTNAVRHAHAHLPPQTPVEVSMTISPTKLKFEVIDRGKQFDLLAHLARSPTMPDVHATHGRGLHLLANIADRLDYQRLSDDRNCLYFERSFDSENFTGDSDV